MRRFTASLLGALLWFAGSLGARSGIAAPSVTVAVDCPDFEVERRAALDARARADLLVQDAGGTLVVACRDRTAVLSWHPLAGAPSTVTASLTGDARTSIDRVLEALDALLTPALPPAGETATAEVTPPADEKKAFREPAHAEAKPVPEPAEVEFRTAPPSRSHLNRSPRVMLAAGSDAELWSRTGALGVRGWGAVPLPLRFAAGATGTVLWDLASPSGVDARLVRVAIGGDYGIDSKDRFRVGLNGFMELLHAASEGSGSDDRTAFGGSLYASAALLLEPIRLQVGPTFAFRPNELRVEVGTNEALALTHFTVGLAIDVAFGPYP